MNLKRLLLIAVVPVLAAAACQSDLDLSALPLNAALSTPARDLPVSVERLQPRPTPTAVPPEIIAAADAEYLMLNNIYERLSPSVVNIEVVLETPHDSIMTSHASGSGFVFDGDGHIITNAHVVEGVRSISVTFSDGFVASAELVGVDQYSDLAVVRVDIDPARLLPVTFANSDDVRVGQRAIAIGNPFGLASSMTTGIISAVGRQLPSAEMTGGTGAGFQNPSIIQVDAPINPGNSGGPLLNSAGELVGVNTAIRTDTGVFEGVGFAVPSNTVQRVVPDLIDDGVVTYSWIGITSQSSDDGFSVAALADPLDLPVRAGVLISAVQTGSPAARAGLRGGGREVVVRDRPICTGGDIIIAVNGTLINSMDDLSAYLVVNTRPGDSVTVTVVRGADTFDVPVLLDARPTSFEATPQICG
ncbi:MAG TPA: trypsin-like peptidase domain-containing protein [Candidatus Limnocylindrales bacterium]|nr:trypsin-like peptidase domain-containing protein [Candidatus Limnocylindrales bacterium]